MKFDPKPLCVLVLFLAFFSVSAQSLPDLMPMPQAVQLGEGHFPIGKDFSVSIEGNYHPRILAEANAFLRRLDAHTGLFFTQWQVPGQTTAATLVIRIQRPGRVQLHEEEGYSLSVKSDGITLQAITDIGAIRGLETLLQLVQVRDGKYVFPEVEINDAPRFVWRGIMMDVARHYMPLEVIYRNLDAMASVKLNVLHLHLADDQGFRFQSAVFPQLTERASDGLYYTQQELRNLIAYADRKGIMIVPEIDVPGHATAILTAFPHLASKDTTYVLERYAGIFHPTLDPTNEAVYDFLGKLFAEMATIFPSPYLHIGGDETTGKHWDENPKIQAFMKKNGLKDNHALHTYFNKRLAKIVSDLGKQTMGWEEIMAPGMPTSALIQSWRGEWEGVPGKESLYAAARAGHPTTLSNGYYLDLMQPLSKAYAVDPAPTSAELTEVERQRILGGEICMWSELVTAQTIDSRLWPYSAAIAERFWSPEEVNDTEDMYRRLETASLRLEQLGLQHLTSPERILRKLAAGADPAPLRVLLEVVEPMKGYSRNAGGTMYSSFSPLSLWADAATADAKTAREFNQCVRSYLMGASDCGQLKETLSRWAANHELVKPIIRQSPVLKEIEGLSENLSKVAAVGLAALELLETNRKPDGQWLQASRKVLADAKAQGGRTELQILTGVSMLLDRVEEGVK